MIGTKSGKLKAKFLPAIYFDSSVLIDYWMTEGLETERPEGAFEKILDECEAERSQIMRTIRGSIASFRVESLASADRRGFWGLRCTARMSRTTGRAPIGRLTTRYHGYIIGDKSDEVS